MPLLTSHRLKWHGFILTSNKNLCLWNESLIFLLTDESHRRDTHASLTARSRNSSSSIAKFILHFIDSLPVSSKECDAREALAILFLRARSCKSRIHASSRSNVLHAFERHNFPEDHRSIFAAREKPSHFLNVSHTRRLLKRGATFSHLSGVERVWHVLLLAANLFMKYGNLRSRC